MPRRKPPGKGAGDGHRYEVSEHTSELIVRPLAGQENMRKPVQRRKAEDDTECASGYGRGAAFRESGDHGRVQRVLGCLNARVQSFGGVAGQHGYTFLREDGTGVHAEVHIMHGAARFKFACFQRLPPRFQTGEFRQQTRVDVDDLARKRSDERLFQYSHVSRQDDEVYAVRLQRPGEFGLRAPAPAWS